MGCVCGHQICRGSHQDHAGVPVLRETHGESALFEPLRWCMGNGCSRGHEPSLTAVHFCIIPGADTWFLIVQRITYAKTRSDAVAKAEGTYVEKDKTARQKHNQEQRGMSSLLYIQNVDAAMHLKAHAFPVRFFGLQRLLSQTDMPAGHGTYTMKCQLTTGYVVGQMHVGVSEHHLPAQTSSWRGARARAARLLRLLQPLQPPWRR